MLEDAQEETQRLQLVNACNRIVEDALYSVFGETRGEKSMSFQGLKCYSAEKAISILFG